MKSIAEQAAAQVIDAKLNNQLGKNTPKALAHGVDEFANTATGAAFGNPVNLTQFAGNYLGDEVADGADYLGQKIKAQHATEIGKTNQPSSYAAKIHSVQTASQYISPESAANDDSIGDLYAAYEDGLSGDVNAIAERNYTAALSSAQTEVENQRAQRMQQRQAQKVTNSSWENKLSQEIYDHQHSWWGRSAINFFSATASPMFAHAVSRHNALNPLNAMEEVDTGYDPVTGQPVSLKQAYADAAASAAMFAVGGEVGYRTGNVSGSIFWVTVPMREGVAPMKRLSGVLVPLCTPQHVALSFLLFISNM